MKVLVLTQAIDLDDPVLGVYAHLIEEIAKKCKHMTVICLKQGRHSMPGNVSVYSLGKETGRSRLKYIFRFYTYLWTTRREYSTVFVHMNSEYVCMGGLLWRLWGKRIVLWRNHRTEDLYTWFAVHFAHAVCYTSPSAYVARFKHAVRMPVGIDTSVFIPGTTSAPLQSILFFGRLDEVKHPGAFLQAIERLSGKGIKMEVDVIGDPTLGREAYANDLKKRFQHMLDVSFEKAVPNEQAPALYRAHAIYVNLTPSGSFDKTIAEAAASGCIIVAANEVLHGIVPDALMVDPLSAEDVARGIEAALKLASNERAALSKNLRDYVIREHSLALLVHRLMPVLRA